MNGPDTLDKPNPWEKRPPTFGKEPGTTPPEDSVMGGGPPPGPDGEWEPKFEWVPEPGMCQGK